MTQKYNKEYYLKNREKIAEKTKEYQKEYRNRPEIKERVSQKNKEKYRNNIKESLYRGAKDRARKHNLEFSIAIDDIKIPECFPYLKVKLFSGGYSDRTNGMAPTLDRIDNSKGYVVGNIEVISDLANRMKSNATHEQLLLFSNHVIDKFGK